MVGEEINYMNVMYATDMNYAPICGVSLYSLLTNNQQEHIHTYIFEKDLGDEKNRFLELSEEFDVEITFIDVSEIEKLCKELNIPSFRGGYMAYARLFADRYIGKQRVLYLDCDTLVVGQLDDLWKLNLGRKPAAAVLDCIHHYANRFIYKEDSANYINSGVMLIDYNLWCSGNYTKKIEDSLRIIDIHKTATYGDQDILNHAMGEDFYILPPKYNAMYITRYFSASQNYMVLSKNKDSYYSEKIINDSKNDLKIIHFSGRNILRPWVVNNILADDETQQWESYLIKSPWKNFKKILTSNNGLKEKIVGYYLKHDTVFLCLVHRLIKKYSLYIRL